MIYHILNGDSLAYTFPETKLEGEIIVVREGLIEGPVVAESQSVDRSSLSGNISGSGLHSFWEIRADYMGVPLAEYLTQVAAEFEKIRHAPAGSTFNLWFEYDLFCQVNSWFVLSLLAARSTEDPVYAVHTSWLTRDDKNFWNGFGPAGPGELLEAYDGRVLLTNDDIHLGRDLWSAYTRNDHDELRRLAAAASSAFPYIQEVVEAHIDRFPGQGVPGRPERVLRDIIREGAADFPEAFRKFWERESIYGFGDLQLKPLYEKALH